MKHPRGKWAVFVGSTSGSKSFSSANNSQQDSYDGNHQKNVNEFSHGGCENPHEPQDQENDRDNVKDVHLVLSLIFISFKLIAHSPLLKSRAGTCRRRNQRLELEPFGRIRET